MPLRALREDALSATPDGFEVRVSLPWIRSLPLSSVREARIWVDGAERDVEVPSAGRHDRWWHIQDRLVLAGGARVPAGEHEVRIRLRLGVPYLAMGEDELVVPIAESARLDTSTALEHAGRELR